MNILVIESSTTSAKVMLYNTDTASLKLARQTFNDSKIEEGLQDPDDIYNQTLILARSISRFSVNGKLNFSRMIVQSLRFPCKGFEYPSIIKKTHYMQAYLAKKESF